MTLADFEKALTAHGLSIDSKHDKMFGMIGATDGVGLQIAGGVVEVYQYDTTITSGQTMLAGFEKSGLMGEKVLVNKNLMLGSAPRHPKWKQIQDVFTAL